MRACVRACVSVYARMFVGMGACRGVYVWCGFASVVPGEAVHCMYVCMCAFHLLRVVGVT